MQRCKIESLSLPGEEQELGEQQRFSLLRQGLRFWLWDAGLPL